MEHINTTLGQPKINTWSTTACSSRQVQSKYGCRTHQHHPGPTTCASPTINVWSSTACPCIPARKHKRVWNTTSSPWADHNARPTIKVWSTADSSCRQARRHNRNDVNHIITPGNNLDMVRSMACARRNNAATEN